MTTSSSGPFSGEDIDPVAWEHKAVRLMAAQRCLLASKIAPEKHMRSRRPRLRHVFRFAPILVAATLPLTLSGQDSVEAKFRGSIDTANIRESMRRLSARPHHVGSPYDKDNAEWMLARFREWGWDAQIETFDVLFPTPKERLVEMVAPK